MFPRFVVSLLLLGFVAGSVNALSLAEEFAEIPQELIRILPVEIVGFFSGLTAEDHAVVDKLDAEEHTTVHGYLAALNTQSEPLYTKTMEMVYRVRSKINALNEEARAFVLRTSEAIADLMPKRRAPLDVTKAKDIARLTIHRYADLSDAAKEDLQLQFPVFSSNANKSVSKLRAGRHIDA